MIFFILHECSLEQIRSENWFKTGHKVTHVALYKTTKIQNLGVLSDDTKKFKYRNGHSYCSDSESNSSLQENMVTSLILPKFQSTIIPISKLSK